MAAQPKVQVDPLDLENKTSEERIIMALEAIERNGYKPDGKPWLALREAARIFSVSKTTLTARFNGRKTCVDAHAHERRLDKGSEDALVAWIIEMGRRGVPLHPSAVAEHAFVISGTRVGEHWVDRFRRRHPELKAKWTTGLEKCRADNLNEHTVNGFYDILQELVETYQITPENTYNMDEKGIQLGVGKKVLALVDRDQKSVQQVEDGN